MEDDESKPTELDSAESSEPVRLEPEQIDHRIEGTGGSFDFVIGADEQASPESLTEEQFQTNDAGSLLSARLIAILIAIFVVALIGALTIVQRNQDTADIDANRDSLQNIVAENSDESLVSNQEVRTTRAQITEAAIGFVSAPSVEERYKFSRKYPGLKQRMESFYSNHQFYNSPLRPESIRILEPAIIEGIRMYDVVVFWSGIGKVPIPVCETKNGFLVDWEAVQVWQPCPLKDFLSGSVQSDTGFRVEVGPDDFYVSPYTVEKFISLRLTGSRIKHPVYAYLERGSEAEKAFTTQLTSWKSGDYRPFKMILKLEFDRNISRSSIVRIKGVEASSWLRPEKPSHP